VTVDERTRRIGENEALFRDINKQLEELNDQFAAVSERFVIVCECGYEACAARIELSAEEYEQLRADSTQFAVLPGHEASDVETVVANKNGYDVVRKLPGAPAEIARSTDT
jgi:hypothetical protein